VLQGRSDTPLTAQGIEQARQRAETWKAQGIGFEKIISSPLQRARHTAEIIADALSIPLEFDPNWQERDFGNLEGQSFSEVRQQGVDFFEPYTALGESGESQVDMYRRALTAIQDLLHRPPGRYLVVSHGAFLARVMFVVFGVTPQGHYNSPVFWMGNTAYINLAYHADRRQWRWYGFHNPDEWKGLEQ
jgi:broad specificity phosphatase PhoE